MLLRRRSILLAAFVWLGLSPGGLRAQEDFDAAWLNRLGQLQSRRTGDGFLLHYYKGRVYITPPRSADRIEGRKGQRLNKDERVATEEQSQAVVLSLNQAAKLDASSGVVILDPRTLKATHGQLFVKSLGEETKDGIWVQLPVGDVKVFGSEFALTVHEDSGHATVTLLDGQAHLSNAHGELWLTNLLGRAGSDARVAAELTSNAPPRTAAVEARHDLIQWMLYYPAVIAAPELGQDLAADTELRAPLESYRQGNVLKALAEYPAGRSPRSEADLLYQAALRLSVGNVAGAEPLLQRLPGGAAGAQGLAQWSRLATALRQLIAAVKHQPFTRELRPESASEWLAESYYQQSRAGAADGQGAAAWETESYRDCDAFPDRALRRALKAARQATEQMPEFGYAWPRRAEVEFSFGDLAAMRGSLQNALRFGPQNAQARALNGFVHAAQGKTQAAIDEFRAAIQYDGGLGNAWLGLGLCEIRRGNIDAGLEALQIAVTQEPQRSFLRSYLGKAYHVAGNLPRAEQELKFATSWDERDPTPHLYSALVLHQQNRINDAVRELERSKELNDNRAVYRSGLLLDQDRAVRSANLAAIYRDAGLTDWSVREATRAVNYDYANFSAHLFLANSYDALRDPRGITLRYETPWANELFLANLLAPVGAGNLSQNVSQQEYSKLFERQRTFGLFSRTEYLSSGDWLESGSQYGTLGSTGYSVDTFYLSQAGDRPNEDQRNLAVWTKLKQQLTPRDSVLVQVLFSEVETGDLAQYYDQGAAQTARRVRETQTPIFLAGYHHEWSAGQHTLFLAARLDDELRFQDHLLSPFYRTNSTGWQRSRIERVAYDLRYESQLEIYSAEAQHLWQTPRSTTVFGVRGQFGQFESADAFPSATLPHLFNTPAQLAPTNAVSAFDRWSFYGYESLAVFDPLTLTAGLSYDRLHYPLNHRRPPLSGDEADRDLLAPKAGFTWTPWAKTTLRGAYTRSLGGVSFDQSFRLEPVQVAGFLQSYRSLIPESIAGSTETPTFEIWGASLDQQFPRGFYLGATAEWLRSAARRSDGAFLSPRRSTEPPSPFQLRERLRYDEQSVALSLHKLLGEQWSAGVRYRLSRAELDSGFSRIAGEDTERAADLQELNLSLHYYQACGFFASVEALWLAQANFGASAGQRGADFWHFNLYAGYRFLQRRAEVRLSFLNWFGRDYQLNPLNLYAELPRDQTLAASVKLNF